MSVTETNRSINCICNFNCNCIKVSKSFISIVTKYADGYNNKKYCTINEEILSECKCACNCNWNWNRYRNCSCNCNRYYS